MGKLSTSIVKSSFSKNNIAQYKLSILYGVDSLCYCVKHQSGEVLVLKKFDLFAAPTLENEMLFTSWLKDIWETENTLSLSFASVHIAFLHPYYTLVPNKLYQASNKATYLKTLKKESTTPEVYQVNNIATIDAQLVFSLPTIATNFFDNKYNKRAIYYNIFSVLIKAFQTQPRTGKQVCINVHPKVLQLLLFDKQELLFSNQFPYVSEKDFLYYVLLVYNQFKLNPEHTPLLISGQLVKESAIYKNLDRYLRHVSFIELGKSYRLNKQLSESPFYFFFDLLAV